VLPTLHENYGHAIAEALASGCPVLISDHTPWNEAEIKNAGFVRPLTPEAWTEALKIAIQMDEPTYLKMAADTRQYFLEKVDYQQLIHQYALLFS
jgi:glycosyltransferase involved in cell wall biosynthesis